jgi:hypothetical protein
MLLNAAQQAGDLVRVAMADDGEGEGEAHGLRFRLMNSR